MLYKPAAPLLCGGLLFGREMYSQIALVNSGSYKSYGYEVGDKEGIDEISQQHREHLSCFVAYGFD